MVWPTDGERDDDTTDSQGWRPERAGVPDGEKTRATTNFQGVGQQGVLVLWTAPSDPAGAPVIGYKIERSVDDDDFVTQVDNLNTGDPLARQVELPDGRGRASTASPSINSVDVGT